MSRRTMALLSQWTSRVFSVDMDGETVYFKIHDTQTGKGGKEVQRMFGNIQKDASCYSLLVSSGDKIHTARFHWKLKDKLLAALPPQYRFSSMCSFLPGVRDSLVHGYFLQAPSSESSATTERLLRQWLRLDDPLLVCSYLHEENTSRWIQHLWNNEQNHDIVPSEAPESHPATLNLINSDVFYSFQAARDIFKKCADIIPEAASVLELLPCDGDVEARSKPDFPIIVLEGLDATGKTTLTESLRDALGATLLRSPPPCLSPWRARFDQEPPILRRAFYALGNYITAQQIYSQTSKTPVIIDRFWHSTAAYAIATAVNGPVCDLPAEGSELYRWPSDLLQPCVVFLLTLDPEERKRRLKDRGQGETKEEHELDLNQVFRLRVEEAYKRISGPTCISVDASCSAEQVLQQVLLLIKAKRYL
ncbi:UMP-CMP kinase 2, mitochondrial isoform X1 [Hippocampus zosterae]|uniref:UMP-CMP kinase 2, mitochondrial isoform X1 n=1 Tax=Hippocampus zosterae TaxID=109293 RepID=UPI00223C97AC|nr:UMP-CMP kinase 2, mitochondrial isoform X1 [Hippocampus zosterae]